MTKPRAVVHMGPMKTGTTAIGAYFSTATAEGILPPTVIYPTGDLWFPAGGRITKHNQLFDFLVAKDKNKTARKTEIRDATEVEEKVKSAAKVAATVKGGPATVVYVNETLSGRGNTPRLVEMLKKYFDVTLVLAVRSPIAAASSLLVHRIKDWRMDQVDLDLYSMLAADGDEVRFNYARLLGKWIDYPGVTTVLIPYFEDEEDGYAVVDRFMAVITGSRAPRLSDDFGERRIHPSLPLASLKKLIRLKKWKKTWGALPGVSRLLERLFMRTLLHDRTQAVRAGFGVRSTDDGAWVLSPAERERVMSLYVNSFPAIKNALGKQASSPEWKQWFAAEGL